MLKIFAIRELILLSIYLFISFFAYGAEKLSESKKWEQWEEEKLKVRNNFPQYKKNFNHKAIQEKVYQELFLKEESKKPNP